MLLVLNLLNCIGFFYFIACSKERIVGGRQVSIEEFPYQLSLSYNNRYICGAVLISEEVALTAGHCIFQSGKYTVRAGSTYKDKGGFTVFVKDALLHPLREKDNDDYDIAVLKFSQPLKFSRTIKAIQLPQERAAIYPGTKGNVSGWGATSEKYPITSENLRVVEVPVVATNICQQTYDIVQITPRMFCCGYIEGGKDACQGDSGGPFVINGVLYGLVSWGFNCAQPGYPGVYTNIPVLRKFIKDNSGV